ncbi:ATP-binding protein [Stutzerimonas kirkiae]|uniref:histidine kinase n=1 Tax=Stutzerimonas kirkiae TaxID=2211392 RepID=A0A4Q9R2P1_9GAMM|nr:ATP-binding protein [Stutzerimonas kirkiae]TBU92028.1 histidine kinase [Stutzerimonas kirkiae]TBU98433.1 histidine kinase [Stutzerimonas kirkiae]TBV05590.1 histidine kinase [Stutzerimonas kirkiae]TBV10672.1 histidine kinase [Stutzerimonas kirkiae]
MYQLLLRTFLFERRRTLPSCSQRLLELPLRLLQQAGSDTPLLELLPLLRETLGAEAVTLLLPQANTVGWRRLGPGIECGCLRPGGESPMPGAVQLCRGCLAQGRFRAVGGLQVEEGRPALLLADFARQPDSSQHAALRDITRQLGEVLHAFAEERRSRRRELDAERGVLARELHDSVAQQLGYLQIRSCRLQAVLDDPRQRQEAGAMLDDLRNTLQVLHRQVRELISSARLTMDGRSLRQALEASVEEFSRCSRCVFSLDNRLPANQLPADGELQVLQIVREALANVVRHSHARQVWISLLPVGDGVEVEVRDDGVGLPAQLPPTGHFGLRIMQERAAAIGAELTIGPAASGGTCVRLRWGRP